MSNFTYSTGTCGACLDDNSQLINLPCGHAMYCTNCMLQAYNHVNEANPIIQCSYCQTAIDLQFVQPLLSQQLYQHLSHHLLEWTIIPSLRIYCPNLNCTRFIPPSRRNGDTAQCAHCSTQVCIHCKSQSHAGKCPANTEFDETIRLSTANGGQRCPRCAQMIERTEQCQHMICPCGQNFCILCAQVWSHCMGTCENWARDVQERFGNVLPEEEDDNLILLPARGNNIDPQMRWLHARLHAAIFMHRYDIIHYAQDDYDFLLEATGTMLDLTHVQATPELINRIIVHVISLETQITTGMLVRDEELEPQEIAQRDVVIWVDILQPLARIRSQAFLDGQEAIRNALFLLHISHVSINRRISRYNALRQSLDDLLATEIPDWPNWHP